MCKKNVKDFKVGDTKEIESGAFNYFRDKMNKMRLDAEAEAAKLPKPTHAPYAGPYTVYSIELEDPTMTVIASEPPSWKLH